MAMPGIHLDIDQLMNDVIVLTDTKLMDIDAAMTASCNAVAILSVSGWSGEAKDAFIEFFSGFKQEMRVFYENLSTFNEALKKIQEEGEAAYNEGRSLLDALD
ncbi:MAG: WXG100 family type VII secretion target [Clostridiales Family XIII bacterium]|jgi:uncharacterized protein YukE|nr:WXG100 family type VII secretion target [Clostridiales Family XIII bacterium]